MAMPRCWRGSASASATPSCRPSRTRAGGGRRSSPSRSTGRSAIGPLAITPFEQQHGRLPSWGFRVGGFAYSPDVNGLPEAALAALAGVDVWLVDCLRERPHPSHAHLEQTLAWIAELKPRRAILTHMNHEVAYRDLAERLPAGVEPAYDGMVLDLPDA